MDIEPNAAAASINHPAIDFYMQWTAQLQGLSDIPPSFFFQSPLSPGFYSYVSSLSVSQLLSNIMNDDWKLESDKQTDVFL